MPTKITVEKVFEYAKNTLIVTTLSVVSVAMSVLGVKGYKTLKRIDNTFAMMEKPLNVVSQSISDISKESVDLFREILQLVRKDDIAECISSVTKLIKSTSDDLKKQSREVTINKSDYPAYFSDTDEEQKTVKMNVLEYAMFQINNMIGEFTAPAIDEKGNFVQRMVNGKNINQTKIQVMIDNLSSMIQLATRVSADKSVGEQLEDYIHRLEEYELSGQIVEDMKTVATEEIEKLRIAVQGKERNVVVEKISQINENIKYLKSFKNGTYSMFGKSEVGFDKNKIEGDKYKYMFKDLDDGEKYNTDDKEDANRIHRIVDEVNKRLSRDLENNRKILDIFETIEGCEEYSKNPEEVDENIVRMLKSKAINNWTNEYLRNNGLNAPVTSIAFNTMVAISNMRKLSADVSFGKIIDLLKGANLNFAFNNNIN